MCFFQDVRDEDRAEKVFTCIVKKMHRFAGERERVFDGERMFENSVMKEREKTMNKWQERWDENQSVGQWTKSLIPCILEWVEMVKVEYFMTYSCVVTNFSGASTAEV